MERVSTDAAGPNRKQRGAVAAHICGLEPILVSVSTARRLLDIGNTKFWALVKAGKLEMVHTGTGRRSVSYRSIKSLLPPLPKEPPRAHGNRSG